MIKVSIKVLTLLAKLNLRRESQLHPFISEWKLNLEKLSVNPRILNGEYI